MTPVAPQRGSVAFSLIEVTLALGVAGFCLIAIFGLLPMGLSSNQAAIQETLATNILSEVVTDLKNTPLETTTFKSPQFSISVPPDPTAAGTDTTLYFTGNGQQVAGASSVDARFKVTVSFVANNTGAKAATFARLKITWPPAAVNATGSVETFTALDRN